MTLVRLLWSAKTVGTLYFIFPILVGVIGTFLSVYIQMDGLDPVFVNLLYGLFMLFFVIVPMLFCGFGSWLIPLMTGEKDLAFPWCNQISFLLFMLSFFTFLATPFPFTKDSHLVHTVWLIIALHMITLSFVFSAINFIVTIITSDTVPSSRLSPFVWLILIAAFFMLMYMPVVLGAGTLFLSQKNLQLQDEILHDLPRLQVVLFFFSYPGMYVLLLPVFGMIIHVIRSFTGRRLFGEKGVLIGMALIGLTDLVLWEQNLFNAARTADLLSSLHYALLPVTGLAAFIIGFWFLTIRKIQVYLQTPMLWAGGFIFIFLAGILSAFHAPVHACSSLTRVFVFRFYYTALFGAVFSIFSGWYFWFQKISEIQVRNSTGQMHFWMSFIAINMLFLPIPFRDNTSFSRCSFFDTVFTESLRIRIGIALAVFSIGIFTVLLKYLFVKKQ